MTRAGFIALIVAMMTSGAVVADDLDFLLEDAPEPEAGTPAEAPSTADTAGTPGDDAKLDIGSQLRAKPRVLEEIVVTAQKTEQTLQEVPVAVSVVGGQQLRDAGVFGPEGIEDRVPNVELDTDAQAPTIGIRGFSTDSYNVGLEPSVGIIVDEIPLARTEFIPDGLYDIERVEVLRGPQGTLFGKNTIAGVLIFSTGTPHEETALDVTLTGGEDDARRVEASLNVPVTDNFFTRGAAVDWKDSGEIDNSFLDRRELLTEQQAGRLKFAWHPLDDLTLRLGTQLSDTTTTYSGWQLYKADPDALAYARSKDPQTEDDPFDSHTSFDLPGYVDRKTSLTHAIAEYDLTPGITMMVIGGHGTLENDILMDFDVSAADLVRVGVGFDHEQDSLELRFTGSQDAPFDTSFDFVGGLFAYQGEMNISVDVGLGEDAIDFALTPAGAEALGLPLIDQLGDLLGGPLIGLPVPPIDLDDGTAQRFDQTSETIAAFGQATWYFAERWSAVAGLRLGREEKDATLMVQDRGLGITSMILSAENFTTNLERRERETSPKLGIAYEFSDDINTYLNWTRGFKSGGFNAISFQNRNLSFEPEQGDNYELGLKSKFLDGTLGLNLTVYHTEVTDMQVVNFNGIGFDVFNAAEALLEGIEADVQWLTPWEPLSINAALAVARAEYESYPNAPAPAGSAETEQDLTGETLPKAPKVTASLSPTLEWPLVKDLKVTFGVNISHRGEQYLALDLDPATRQKAHTLYDAHIAFGPESSAWSLVLRGENLSDTQALNFVADHNLYANSYFSSQIPTRKYSLSLNANW